MSYLGEITIDLASCVAKYEIANLPKWHPSVRYLYLWDHQPLPLHRCINPPAPGVAIPRSLLISVINLFAAVIIKFNILWSSDVPVLRLYRFRSMPAMGNTTTFALLIFESLLIVSSWLVVRRTVIFVCMSLRVISQIPPAIYIRVHTIVTASLSLFDWKYGWSLLLVDKQLSLDDQSSSKFPQVNDYHGSLTQWEWS